MSLLLLLPLSLPLLLALLLLLPSGSAETLLFLSMLLHQVLLQRTLLASPASLLLASSASLLLVSWTALLLLLGSSLAQAQTTRGSSCR